MAFIIHRDEGQKTSDRRTAKYERICNLHVYANSYDGIYDKKMSCIHVRVQQCMLIMAAYQEAHDEYEKAERNSPRDRHVYAQILPVIYRRRDDEDYVESAIHEDDGT
jgi:hypothetical protein